MRNATPPAFLSVKEEKNKRNGIELPLECMLREESPLQGGHAPGPHYHDYIEFLFGLDACEVTAWIAGEPICLSQGDLLIVNANVSHTFEAKRPNSRYLCIKILPEVIYFTENPMYDVKYVVPFLQPTLLPYQYFPNTLLANSPLSHLFLEMMDTWNHQEYGYEIALKSLFLQVFLWVIRYNRQHNPAMEPTAKVSFENIRLIQQSMEYINKNFADVTETDAAAYINVSYSYYSKLFRRVVGKNFQEYLTAVRINEAERLLLSSSLSITEIAYATGFSTSSHFIECFRKIKKNTPKQYRLKWRQ